MNKKTVSNSQVIMHELVLPNETNVHGNIFGGKVMYYMDYIKIQILLELLKRLY